MGRKNQALAILAPSVQAKTWRTDGRQKATNSRWHQMYTPPLTRHVSLLPAISRHFNRRKAVAI